MTVKKYVVGIVLDKSGKHVLLLQKKHGPKRVVGKWNGPGGKIELGEHSRIAVAREFEEECGLAVFPAKWRYFCTLANTQHEVEFFTTFMDIKDMERCKAQTDEPIQIFHTDDLPKEIVPNIRWMIPFILDTDTELTLGVLKMREES